MGDRGVMCWFWEVYFAEFQLLRFFFGLISCSAFGMLYLNICFIIITYIYASPLYLGTNLVLGLFILIKTSLIFWVGGYFLMRCSGKQDTIPVESPENVRFPIV